MPDNSHYADIDGEWMPYSSNRWVTTKQKIETANKQHLNHQVSDVVLFVFVEKNVIVIYKKAGIVAAQNIC